MTAENRSAATHSENPCLSLVNGFLNGWRGWGAVVECGGVGRAILGSRALLFPGAQPPLSHLGITLLRHVIGSGARYAFYQLGLPMPEAPPIRIVRLRLYLDAGSLGRSLGEAKGGDEVKAALLEPGGVSIETLPTATAAGAVFHRMRLRLAPRRLPRLGAVGEDAPWPTFRRAVSAVVPTLNDAFLAEVVGSLDRRAQRRRGRAASPVAGAEAAAWRGGKAARLSRLGDPDLLVESWAAGAPARPPSAETEPAPAHPHRGAFRERYRQALDLLIPERTSP